MAGTLIIGTDGELADGIGEDDLQTFIDAVREIGLCSWRKSLEQEVIGHGYDFKRKNDDRY